MRNARKSLTRLQTTTSMYGRSQVIYYNIRTCVQQDGFSKHLAAAKQQGKPLIGSPVHKNPRSIWICHRGSPSIPAMPVKSVDEASLLERNAACAVQKGSDLFHEEHEWIRSPRHGRLLLRSGFRIDECFPASLHIFQA